jgi:hypothetical protein
MPDITDCNTAGLAITTASLALIATALAVTSFALAYVAKTIKGWWDWRK